MGAYFALAAFPTSLAHLLEQALAIVSSMQEKECLLEGLRIVMGMPVSDQLLFDLLVAANHVSLR
jgi:hypothetical protein